MLDSGTNERIKEGLITFGDDPFRRRSDADIKRLVTVAKPPLFRLCIDDYRAIYFVVQNEVRITEIIHGSIGYSWLE
jgi:mRNA-degrading endonuclease RelE of RelBE toxin-antitoxin system